LPSVEQAKARQAEQAKIRDAQQEREEQQRTEDFKRHAEREASKALHDKLYAAADAEARRIERERRELTARHIEQQRIHQNAATRQRNDAEQAIKDTYRIEEATQQIKSAQAALKAKGSLWDKITGKHEREQKAIQQEIKDLRRTIADAERRAAEYRQHIDNLIRQDADKLAQQQKQERESLPPEPERDHSRQAEREQGNSFERSRERGRSRGNDPP